MLRKTGLTAASLLVLIGAVSVSSTASADPTCANVFDSGLVVHGQHIIANYVLGNPDLGDVAWPPKGAVKAKGGAAVPGGPGPAFHFVLGLPPGASFCVAQAKSQNAADNNNAVKDDLP